MRAPRAEGEQRVIRLEPIGEEVSIGDVFDQYPSEPRSEWHEPVLSKLGLINTEQVAVEVDILSTKPGNLSDSQA